MDWSRSQRGVLKINFDIIDIVKIINNLIALLNETASRKNISILSKVKINTFIYADANMVNSILNNLLTNAIKFNYPNGKIYIEAEESDINVIIKIIDNGIGMSKDVIDNLFRIDANNSTPGTNNEIGTGLGLILCKEFAEKLNGDIYVESELNKGSSFYLVLPKK